MACRGMDPAKTQPGHGVATSAAAWEQHATQAMNTDTISDRGTWLSFASKGDLTVLVERDP